MVIVFSMPTQPRSAAGSGTGTASEHLLYEIEMLGHAAQLLYDHPGARSDYWVHKTAYFALLESLLTHTRSLMSFFHHAGRLGQNDVQARDYISGWRPPKKWAGFDQDRDRIGNEISHLSFRRPDSPGVWNYGRLVEELNMMLRHFIDEVPEAHVAEGFKDRARATLTNPFGGWVSTPTQTSQSMTRLQERR